ncbi:MAG: DEAD/DEAH box helicase [Candidatus Cloacimonetes bacterium]|nr:DEAD/DEAH box helicase [Candidatus Cloacimonadota bacterium]MCK9185169.1 DEAD/DEAH box helicase [Candidatus Cloacimonadota bacterium]
MNVFELKDKLISDYSSFVKGFITIKDEAIKRIVSDELNGGLLWPDPLLQISPFFVLGEQIEQLISQGILHPDCAKIFRIKNAKTDLGKAMQLYRHQAEAIKQADKNFNYVLTTGTGSGKSLAYIIPIVNHILKTGSGKGIKAIIVYPMNALANSQEKELEKFIDFGFPNSDRAVTFKRYTGQESTEQKLEICTNPPDIILTNYVMLELILTRPDEAPLVKACSNLKFLVLDELHTYRGRQGADVAMLIRRTKEATKAKDIICVGTSATMSSSGDLATQNQEISRVASLLFGSPVFPENIIAESLQRVTVEYDFQQSEYATALQQSIKDTLSMSEISFEQIQINHLASWIETTFGLGTEQDTGRLIRSTPKSISGENGGAFELSLLTGLDIATCTEGIQHILMLGYQSLNPANGFPVFAFRLHQFISRGDTVYASLDEPEIKHLTIQRQLYVPGSNKSKILLPLTFCRHCGQEFYTVLRSLDEEQDLPRYYPRELNDLLVDENQEAGFLFDPLSNTDEQIVEEFPTEWKDQNGKVLSNRKAYLPKPVLVAPNGLESKIGRRFLYLSAPFRYCPACGVSFAPNQRSDFAKLSALGTEGRSTATTILSLSAVRHLRKMDVADKAKKLLSFTDNRQDASLQAGHFNDFIQVGIMRGALYRALANSGSEGIRHSELPQVVFNSLNLPYEEYSSNPTALKGVAKIETDRAFRNVLGYHLYRDLKRGWRITAPNLEQTGLLEIDYLSIQELAADQEQWASSHPALAGSDQQTRLSILKILLDQMRRGLAIKVSYLNPQDQEQIVQQSQQRLIPPWGFDENELPRNLIYAAVLYPRSRKAGKDDNNDVFLSTRSGFAQYLRRSNTFTAYQSPINLEETQTIIENLLSGLESYGLIESVKQDKDGLPGYQLVADAIVWKAGDGTKGYYDPIRQPSESLEGQPVNQFFKEFYQIVALSALGLESREHTAQVSYDEREHREEDFRRGSLPILYCSPTMELGIDISQLNVVNMRNIPPTPANYAQRSGRAGRSGQPALIFSYCSTGSPHDQYFFKRPQNMVSGAVATPQIDIANEDMLHSHVNAIWLSEAKLKLGSALTELIDTSGQPPSLELLPSVLSTLNDLGIRSRAQKRAELIIYTIAQYLDNSVWYTSDWLSDVFNQIPQHFEQACERWRELYKAALKQQDIQNKIRLDASRPDRDKKQAQRLRLEAESQLDILTSAKGSTQSDFYSYRYFASEGFLPGYNFPRLPLSAFIPGRRVKSGRDEYVSRPRFLAITEFGPRSFVYHEGSRYIINQVIMPAQDSQDGIVTNEAKLCPECGYLCLDKLDSVCDNCKSQLDAPIPNLFRLQNVVAKRRDQINCDEEERLRLGFDVRTTMRFATRNGNLACIKAELKQGDDLIAKLIYGDSATLWRINMGYRKRRTSEPEGFWLDTERGYWDKRPGDDDADDDSPMSRNKILVRPYVSDTKNCLLFEPKIGISNAIIASLQSALKNAIQQVFELEDSELSVEPLPSKDNRKSILFYESTEGGAGVLKQVLDAGNFKRVIKAAIELCHYDSDSFEDLKRAKNSKEDCEAACYDCLLSYSNQTDHALLDRKAIIDILITLLVSDLSRSSSGFSRVEHYERLKKLAGSTLEIKWLDYIYNNGYILPKTAQQLIEECHTRPDFIYQDKYTAIYIDGPVHDTADQRAKDKVIADSLNDLGWHIIRFRYDGDWQSIISNYANIFGEK